MRLVTCHPEVKWSVVTRGLLLFRPDEAPRVLGYPEAALWDLLSRNVPYDRAIRLFAAIAYKATDDRRSASAVAKAAIGDWLEDGLLVSPSRHRGGT